MNIRRLILQNLGERVHPVNLYITTHGSPSLQKGLAELKTMYHEGLVKIEEFHTGAELYQLTAKGHQLAKDYIIQLVVDNTKK